MGLKYAKADKPFGKTAGKIRFENQDDRATALEALNGKKFDGWVCYVRLPADMGGETGATRVRGGRGGGREASSSSSAGGSGSVGEDSNELHDTAGDGEEGEDGGRGGAAAAATVADAITPWHAFDYDTQIVKKYRHMRDILEKISKRVRKDSPAALPRWLVPVFQLRTKPIPCPLEQVIPSPSIEGYRNKTELTIGLNQAGEAAIGFLLGAMKNGISAVADPSEARSVSPVHAAIHKLMEPYVLGTGLPVWDRTTHTGFWRLLLIRSTVNQDSLIMLQVNSNAVTPEMLEKVKKDVVDHVTTSSDPVAQNSTFHSDRDGQKWLISISHVHKV
jgi:hypothetical protein